METIYKVKKHLLPDFVLMDDEPINNFITRKAIVEVFPDANVTVFTDPQKGLEYLEQHYAAKEANSVVFFLDIRMNHLDGWKVLELFSKFHPVIKNKFTIFLLTTSFDPLDKFKLRNHPDASGFITKPLKTAFLESYYQGIVEIRKSFECKN